MEALTEGCFLHKAECTQGERDGYCVHLREIAQTHWWNEGTRNATAPQITLAHVIGAMVECYSLG